MISLLIIKVILASNQRLHNFKALQLVHETSKNHSINFLHFYHENTSTFPSSTNEKAINEKWLPLARNPTPLPLISHFP